MELREWCLEDTPGAHFHRYTHRFIGLSFRFRQDSGPNKWDIG